MSASRRPREPEFDTVELSAIRKAIGDRTQTSFRDIPQFSLSRLVVVRELVKAREKLKREGAEPLPTYNDYFLKLVATVLPDFPTFNCWYEDEQIKLLRPINIGFVCDTEQGLLLPTVFDADQKSLTEIAEETRELITQARAGKLRASRQQGAGISLTNIGPTGVDLFHGIISPPQTAILAIGSLTERPVVEQGELRAAPTVYLTVTLDHRVNDGRQGALFLAALAANLGEPELLASL